MNDQSSNELKELRHMSAREFMRNASEVLDGLQRGGDPIVLTRYNRRAVIITPIHDMELRERIKRAKPVKVGPVEPPLEDVAIPNVTLTDVQRRVLLLIAGSSPKGWYVDYLGSFARQGFIEANMLDIGGLVRPRGGRFVTTKVGQALALKVAEEEAG